MNDSLSFAKDSTYLSNAEAMWFDIWLYGIIIDEGRLTEPTVDNPSGIADLNWYLPDEEDTEYPLIEVAA